MLIKCNYKHTVVTLKPDTRADPFREGNFSIGKSPESAHSCSLCNQL